MNPIQTITMVCAGSGAGTNVSIPATNFTGSTLLVTYMATYAGGGARSVTDDSGGANTWTPLTRFGFFSPAGQFFYAQNPGSVASLTVSATSSAGFPSICVGGFSGTALSGVADQESGHDNTGTTNQAGSITPTTNGQLVCAGNTLNASQASTPTIDSGFGTVAYVDFTANHFGAAMSCKVQMTAAAVNPQWAWPTSTFSTAVITSYKAP